MLRAWSALLWATLLAAGCGGGGGGGGSSSGQGGGAGPDASALDRDMPTVTYVTPSNGAAGVGTNARLTVSFSEPMNPGSVASALSLVDEASGAAVAQRVDYDAANHIATLTPQTALAASGSYRAEVSTAAKDLAGKTLASAYTWRFGTAAAADSVAPRVTSYAPAAGATRVPTRSAVAMAFSEPMDAASVGRAFTLRCNGAVVAGRMDYVGQAAAFRPDAALAPGAACAASLGAGATDLAGNALQPEAWAFATAAEDDVTPPQVLSVSPANGASNVPRHTALSVSFDEAIYPFVYGSIDGVLLEVAIDYATNTVSMTPTGALRAAAGYDAAVRASDLAGNRMAEPYRWRFATAP